MKIFTAKLTLVAIFSLFLVIPAHANLLTAFTSVDASVDDFSVNSGPYDTWLKQFGWRVVDGGQNGAGDYWAKHRFNAVPLFQGITGQDPGLYEISLDYIYETGAAGATDGRTSVYVIGLNSGQTFSRFDTEPPPNQGTVLYNHDLTPPAADSWTPFSDTFQVSSQYDAWVFVVWSEAYLAPPFPPSTEIPGLRGIDNAYLDSVAVPVPGTFFLLLFGTGIIGIGRYVQKKFKHKS